MKAFIESQFGIHPLIFAFHSRGVNSKITIYMSDRCELSIQTTLVFSKIYLKGICRYKTNNYIIIYNLRKSFKQYNVRHFLN